MYFFLATCARLSRSHSAFESTINSSIVSYRIVLHHSNPQVVRLFQVTRFSFVFLLQAHLNHETTPVTVWISAVMKTAHNARGLLSVSVVYLNIFSLKTLTYFPSRFSAASCFSSMFCYIWTVTKKRLNRSPTGLGPGHAWQSAWRSRGHGVTTAVNRDRGPTMVRPWSVGIVVRINNQSSSRSSDMTTPAPRLFSLLWFGHRRPLYHSTAVLIIVQYETSTRGHDGRNVMESPLRGV